MVWDGIPQNLLADKLQSIPGQRAGSVTVRVCVVVVTGGGVSMREGGWSADVCISVNDIVIFPPRRVRVEDHVVRFPSFTVKKTRGPERCNHSVKSHSLTTGA